MKIVLDTNCLLRSIPPKSDYHCILTSLHGGRFILCYSNEILTEYEEVLTRFYTPSITYNVLNFIVNSPHAQRISPYYKWKLVIGDPDDNKFVDCALNAGADMLVSNDKHFNVLKEVAFPTLQVVDIEMFKNILLT